MTTTRLYKPGDKVECNGNKEAFVLRYPYPDSNMVEVRLYSGFRHVGDVCVDEKDLRPRRDL